MPPVPALPYLCHSHPSCQALKLSSTLRHYRAVNTAAASLALDLRSPQAPSFNATATTATTATTAAAGSGATATTATTTATGATAATGAIPLPSQQPLAALGVAALSLHALGKLPLSVGLDPFAHRLPLTASRNFQSSVRTLQRTHFIVHICSQWSEATVQGDDITSGGITVSHPSAGDDSGSDSGRGDKGEDSSRSSSERESDDGGDSNPIFGEVLQDKWVRSKCQELHDALMQIVAEVAGMHAQKDQEEARARELLGKGDSLPSPPISSSSSSASFPGDPPTPDAPSPAKPTNRAGTSDGASSASAASGSADAGAGDGAEGRNGSDGAGGGSEGSGNAAAAPAAPAAAAAGRQEVPPGPANGAVNPFAPEVLPKTLVSMLAPACSNLARWRRCFARAQLAQLALAHARERESRARDPPARGRTKQLEFDVNVEGIGHLGLSEGGDDDDHAGDGGVDDDVEALTGLRPTYREIRSAPKPEVSAVSGAPAVTNAAKGAAPERAQRSRQDMGVAGCAPGCPWCQQEGSEARAWAERQQGREGGDQGERFECVYGDWPVDPKSPFFWRRLWWGLLGRLSPRTRDLLRSQAGMCPHSSDCHLWHAVYATVKESLPWGDPRVTALAGATHEDAVQEPVQRAAAAYARALNSAFAEVGEGFCVACGMGRRHECCECYAYVCVVLYVGGWGLGGGLRVAALGGATQEDAVQRVATVYARDLNSAFAEVGWGRVWGDAV